MSSHNFPQSSHTVGSCGNKIAFDFSALGSAKERCLLTFYAFNRGEWIRKELCHYATNRMQ